MLLNVLPSLKLISKSLAWNSFEIHAPAKSLWLPWNDTFTLAPLIWGLRVSNFSSVALEGLVISLAWLG